MKNKIVVITGGASGIGFAIAKQLANSNTVISIDRTPAKIEGLKVALPKVVSMKADITSSDDLNKVIDQIAQSYGRIDLLINNAGKGTYFNFVKIPEQELMENIVSELAVNYTAPILLTKKALPLLQKSSEPIVVIVSSGLAYLPVSKTGSYCATKSAIHFIAMSLRPQLRRLNIRVVEVLPPVVETDMGRGAAVKVARMPADKFASLFISKLKKGEEVMNIGQTALLEKFTRFFPKAAFKMFNK